MHMNQERPSLLTSGGLYLGLIFISVSSITIFYYLKIILRIPKGVISFLINYSFLQQGSIITCSHVQICNLISKHKHYFTKNLSVSPLCNQRSINIVSWWFLGSLHFEVKPYHYFIITNFNINEKFKSNNYIDPFEDIFTQQGHSSLRVFSTQRI